MLLDRAEVIGIGVEQDGPQQREEVCTQAGIPVLGGNRSIARKNLHGRNHCTAASFPNVILVTPAFGFPRAVAPGGRLSAMASRTELDKLDSGELHDRAVKHAAKHLDLKFFWRLIEALPAAEAAAGELAEAERDVSWALAHVNDLTDSGRGRRPRCFGRSISTTSPTTEPPRPSGLPATLRSPMEASPREPYEVSDQLPLDHGPASVRALGDRIVIEALTVDDERAARIVRERAESGTGAAETIAKAIEIGARVLDSEGTAANVDYVQRVFEERVARLGDDLSGTLEEGSAEIAKHIAESFDVERSDSVQGEIKQMLSRRPASAPGAEEDAHGRGLEQPAGRGQMRTTKAMIEVEERHRKQLDGLRESGAKEHRALHAQVRELTERFSVHLERSAGEENLAEAEAAGTRKGFNFEERVHEGSSGSRPPAATPRLTPAPRAPRAAAGRATPSSSWRGPWPVDGPDRLRGQGQEALQERCVGRAQRGDGSPRRLVRRPRGRRAGARSLRPRAPARVRGQQADRRRRPGRTRVACPRRRLPARRSTGLDGPRPRAHRRCSRGAGSRRGRHLLPEAGTVDPHGADRHQDLLRQGPRGLDEMVGVVGLKLDQIDALVAEAADED